MSEVTDWVHKKINRDIPDALIERGPGKSKSPKSKPLDDAKFAPTIRFCKNCGKYTTFICKLGQKHSKCMECGYGSIQAKRSNLTRKIRKVFHK